MITVSDKAIFETQLCTATELSLTATLECGQCFRWQNFSGLRASCGSESGQGVLKYGGIVSGFPVFLWLSGSRVFIRGFGGVEFWRDYFDLCRDYSEILPQFGDDSFTLSAIEFGKGLRILRQDAWEMLCSYLISQNNNIPRISASIAKLCRYCGEVVSLDGVEFFKFPSAGVVGGLGEGKLRDFGVGYRAGYILDAAKAVNNGEINFEQLRKLSTVEARSRLLELRGVGAKVADCVLLFGLGKLDAFPVDTWMEKAKKYYEKNLNAEKFGKFAGIAQEYIFYYIRTGLGKKNK
ncbi:MAG: hypothetical protein LBT09_06490 [Planctomycetaceae bacterium]|nr:hypothetical protein [Planctomycetaceae bacterium]